MAKLEVICEDGPVIAVNKPSGVISQGAPAQMESLADQVKSYLKKKYEKPGKVYLGIPHRLDRSTSGVSVFSRNSKCAARLSEQFAKRKVCNQHGPDERAGSVAGAATAKAERTEESCCAFKARYPNDSAKPQVQA